MDLLLASVVFPIVLPLPPRVSRGRLKTTHIISSILPSSPTKQCSVVLLYFCIQYYYYYDYYCSNHYMEGDSISIVTTPNNHFCQLSLYDFHH